MSNEQIVKYLSDAHSIEEQALAQLRGAPDMAGDDRLAAAFREHLVETEDQERRVDQRLEQLGGSPSKLKDTVMAAGGKGFALFAKLNPDTPGKLAAHAHSYEALELGSYELLERTARQLGDEETAQLAAHIKQQEEAMLNRIAACFDGTVEMSLRDKGAEDLDEEVNKYLSDAHALENQAIGLLERGPKVVKDAELARIMEEHLEESRRHQQRIEDRLKARGDGPSRLKDAAMKLGALNWGGFFQAHPDTPGKLWAFAFAFEHLEIGGYEQLRRVAERAGDHETVRVAEEILAEERAAADKIAAQWDRAARASLSEQGVQA